MGRVKFLTLNEIVETGSRLSGGWPFLFSEILKHDSLEAVTLHRSIYRDYFAIAFREILNADEPLSEDVFDDFFDRYVGHFISGHWDFLNLVPMNTLAKKNGWINPFGWDSDTGKIITPFTKLFNESALLSAMLENFHRCAVMGALSLTDYEQTVVRYIDDAIRVSQTKTPIYDAIIQAQSQTAEYAIRVRQEFEVSQGRPMLRQDWEDISHDLYKIFMRKAAGSRIDSFMSGISVCYGAAPFSFSLVEDNKLTLSEGLVNKENAAKIAIGLGQGDFIERYTDQPVTGCPALYSKQSADINLVSFVTKRFISAVANDFWPVAKVSSPLICPFQAL